MKRKEKPDKQVLIIALVVAALFVSFFSLLGFAFFRINYVRGYMRQVGVNFTGNVKVYAEVDGEKYLLSHDNANKIGKIAVVGTINMKRHKDKTTGKKIVFTTIASGDVKRTAEVEELENGRVAVTIKNENGKKKVVLDDSTYFSINRVVVANVATGENTIVDEIP